MKKQLRTIILFSAILIASTQSYSQTLRGMYVNKFNEILGNAVKEDSLLHYAQDSSFNYLALYNLHNLNFSSSSDMNKLSSFISRARTVFGMQYIGAVGETYTSFRDKIKPYNDSHSVNEKFNVFNLEFEFWINSSVNAGGIYCTSYLTQANCSCDTAGAFHYYIQLLHQMDSLAATQNAISETYVGWFNQGQGSQIQQNVSRILLHAYRVDASSVFGYSKTRMGYLASNNQNVTIVPIFSAESSFMGPWLTAGHALQEASNKYVTDFTADNSSWKQYVTIAGYQWFAQSYLPKPIPGTFAPVITSSGTTTFCAGENVTLTATTGTNYLWSNGATTQSITVNTAGNFSCAVTLNGNTVSTSPISVTVNDAPTAAIITNAAVGTTVPLASNATAGSGTINLYQWYLWSSPIAGATAADYVATTDGDYELDVTNTNGCSVTSSTVSVTVPVVTCSPDVPTETASYNMTGNSITLHWNVASGDSVIIRYKPEYTSTYTYIRMLNTGQTTFTLSGLQTDMLYSWRVKTVCGNTSSNYSPKKYFSIFSGRCTANNSGARLSYYAITDELDELSLIAFPNPATENFKLYFNLAEESKVTIEMMDLGGRILSSENINAVEGENIAAVDISKLTKGIYVAVLKNAGMSSYKKIMVE